MWCVRGGDVFVTSLYAHHTIVSHIDQLKVETSQTFGVGLIVTLKCELTSALISVQPPRWHSRAYSRYPKEHQDWRDEDEPPQDPVTSQ